MVYQKLFNYMIQSENNANVKNLKATNKLPSPL